MNEEQPERNTSVFQPVIDVVERLFTVYGEAGNALMQPFAQALGHASQPMQENLAESIIPSEAIQQWTIKGENWMSKAALAQLEQYTKPPQSITATITTDEGHTYKGVLYLVEEPEQR